MAYAVCRMISNRFKMFDFHIAPNKKSLIWSAEFDVNSARAIRLFSIHPRLHAFEVFISIYLSNGLKCLLRHQYVRIAPNW